MNRSPLALVEPRVPALTSVEPGPTPVLHLDTAVVAARYAALAGALQGVRLHYAVKANPARPVLTTLARLGCRWDVASPGEINAVLAAGGRAQDMSYGNTVKRSVDIAYAHAVGVRRFTFDSPGELNKLSAAAPGSTVVVRITTSGAGADWPLNGKFGCPAWLARELLDTALDRGHTVGIAFHVGSQQHDIDAWDAPLRITSRLRAHLRSRRADLAVVNLGGGFPAGMLEPTPTLEAYGAAIRRSLSYRLGPDAPEIMAEPGRCLVADAGVLDTEVVLVSDRRGEGWVYLDAGVFTGLVETIGEAIRYRVVASRDGLPLGGATSRFVLAGPTCDSLDILYRQHRYELPRDLRPRDRLSFLGAGAYTASYSTVGFNGFDPLRETFR